MKRLRHWFLRGCEAKPNHDRSVSGFSISHVRPGRGPKQVLMLAVGRHTSRRRRWIEILPEGAVRSALWMAEVRKNSFFGGGFRLGFFCKGRSHANFQPSWSLRGGSNTVLAHVFIVMALNWCVRGIFHAREKHRSVR